MSVKGESLNEGRKFRTPRHHHNSSLQRIIHNAANLDSRVQHVLDNIRHPFSLVNPLLRFKNT
jgi:hypothetical protein